MRGAGAARAGLAAACVALGKGLSVRNSSSTRYFFFIFLEPGLVKTLSKSCKIKVEHEIMIFLKSKTSTLVIVSRFKHQNHSSS